MPHVWTRATALLRRPWVWVALGVLALGGVLLVRLPLFGLPGYELSCALTVAISVLGGGVGMAAARQERQLIGGVGPRPPRAKRLDNPLAAAAAATLAASVALSLAVGVPFSASVVYAYFSTRCNPFAQLGFFPVLVAPGVLMSSAAGVLAGLSGRRVWGAWLLYVLFLAASLVYTLRPILVGPQVFAFNHFAGYFPGPLYDEAISLPASLLWFRLETLFVATGVIALTGLLLDPRAGVLSLPSPRLGALALLTLCVVGTLALEKQAAHLGLHRTSAEVAEALGVTRETPELILHHPRSLSPQESDRLLRDASFRYAEVAAFLGEAPREKVEIFVYATPEEKAALVGASHTQFSKPWQRSVHVNAQGFPHPVLKHELVHALSSVWGTGPLRLPGKGLVPQAMALVEGLAVAADPPRTDLTLQEEAAAIRRLGLAPSAAQLFRPLGFYGLSGPRAYTLAGAFVAHLKETYGRDKLRTLYGTGDFQFAYARDLATLAQEWERGLDALPLSPQALQRAQARYRQDSLFNRPCAREVAGLSQRADESLASLPEQALQLYSRCAVLQPDDARFSLGRAAALQKLGRGTEADEALRAVEQRLHDRPTVRAEVTLARADVLLKNPTAGAASAEALLREVLTDSPAAEVERTAEVKLYALQHPALTHGLLGYFDPTTEDLRLYLLETLHARLPQDPIVRYLLGRRLTPHAPAEAVPHLAAAAFAGLPESIQRETWRLWLEALFTSGDCAGVRDAAGRMPDLGQALRSGAAEWERRCAFEQAHFSGPLVPSDPFR